MSSIRNLTDDGVFVHQTAICESRNIGKETKIWAFAHVLPKARIGDSCNICDGVFIENDVFIGDRVTIKCGVQIWDGTHIANDVFIGPNATFTNDPFPRSKMFPEHFHGITIEAGASIGANATLLPGIKIGSGAMVGAGAVVTKDVPRGAIVVGNPARISGYVTANQSKLKTTLIDKDGSTASLGVFKNLSSGASLIRLPEIVDLRGKLSFAEVGQYLPFTPERYFLIYDVPSKEVRGEHAHLDCHQFLVCVKGSVTAVTDNIHHKDQIILDTPLLGLHIPPKVWGIQFQYSSEAVLLVFASHKYNGDDYVRNYDDFKKLKEIK